MAAKLCLQDNIKLVGFCSGGNHGNNSSSADSKLAELESCNKEPGGEFEV